MWDGGTVGDACRASDAFATDIRINPTDVAGVAFAPRAGIFGEPRQPCRKVRQSEGISYSPASQTDE
jgi:hypothetical protein